jgi:hypothetical protein
MESAVANLCSPGDRVVVVSAGAFGERWQKLAGAYGADVQAVEYEWGETPRAEDLGARLDELGGAKVVFLTHSETSTGVVCDLQALAAAARPSGALVVADAVSSLGAVPLEPDVWGLDVVASRLAEGADDAARWQGGLYSARGPAPTLPQRSSNAQTRSSPQTARIFPAFWPQDSRIKPHQAEFPACLALAAAPHATPARERLSGEGGGRGRLR